MALSSRESFNSSDGPGSLYAGWPLARERRSFRFCRAFGARGSFVQRAIPSGRRSAASSAVVHRVHALF